MHIYKDGNDDSVQDSKRDTDVKNRLLDSVGESKGGMIWENSIEMCIICETDLQSRFDARDRVPRADTLGWPWGMRGWDGDPLPSGERGNWDEEHMYTDGWFMSMYGKNHYIIVK